jgi:hypothetical protein
MLYRHIITGIGGREWERERGVIVPKLVKARLNGCLGMRFVPRQGVSKKIVDAQHPEVTAWRCECFQCGHVFRVYPKGVSQKRISKCVKGMAVMMYILGLSYGAAEIVLSSLGMGDSRPGG